MKQAKGDEDVEEVKESEAESEEGIGNPSKPPRRTLVAGIIKKGKDFDLKAYREERKYLGKMILYPEY